MGGHLCRIGVFYDGTYVLLAQRYFYRKQQLGWLKPGRLHTFLEGYVRTVEPGFSSYRVVYAAWFQGLQTVAQADDRQLRHDRIMAHDLLHAGVRIHHLPVSTEGKEKGVDVALAVDALSLGLTRSIDVAVLVTGDGDYVPLVRELMKAGVRVLVAYFEYEDGEEKAFANERLLTAATFEVNLNGLASDRQWQSQFASVFEKPRNGT